MNKSGMILTIERVVWGRGFMNIGYALFKSPLLWKDSLTLASAILALIATIMGVAGISLDCIGHWYTRLLMIAGVYAMLAMVILILKYYRAKKGLSLSVRGIEVKIMTGDIFKAKGWKVIPFNEYYDTQVDDVVISRSSLNGQFITEHITDLAEFQQTISAYDNSPLLGQRVPGTNKCKYPLGRIIPYDNEFMLLAFSQFNQQYEAHINWSEYERCLRHMWQEICRTYADRPIYLPLLGGGITRFNDRDEKRLFDLLHCMLCSLRTSNVHINQPITILLTEKAMQETNIYELKGVK